MLEGLTVRQKVPKLYFQSRFSRLKVWISETLKQFKVPRTFKNGVSGKNSFEIYWPSETLGNSNLVSGTSAENVSLG